MWIGKRGAQDHLNDYWNALDRHAPPDELARLRALNEPELMTTIERTRARFRRLRPDPAFSDRLEGDIMNAFALSSSGSAALPRIPAPPSNGRHAPSKPSAWMPAPDDSRIDRRRLALQLGMVALVLLTLIGGVFVYANRSGHPAVLQPATPVSTPTEDWTNTRGDAGRSGLGESGPAGQPVTIWRFHADGPCDTAPAAVGDTIFAACGNGILYAIDRATGTERWQFSAQSPVVGGPTVHQGIVVLVDVDGRLYGVDAASGQQVWLDDGTFFGAPVAEDGIVAVGGFDGQLVAVDIATGQERWRYEVDTGGEAKNPAIGDGIVYAGSIANGFSAVDLQTGALVWHADTNGIETGTAVVANGVAYIGSSPGVPQGFLNAYDAATGTLLWSSSAPIFTPAVQDGRGFAGSGGGEVTSLDLATGDILWQVTVGGVARPAMVAGNVVYMNSDGDETVYAFDTETGHELWSYPVDGYLGDAGALKDGVLYVNTGGGSVYAIGGEHAIPAAGAATPLPAASAIPNVAAATPSMAGSPVARAASLLWSSSGGDGGFARPGRVAVAPNGQIWVIDSDNQRFQIFDTNGNFLETWGEQGSGDGQFQFLTRDRHTFGDIVFLPDGSFYVLDPGNGRVQAFGPDREFRFSFGGFGTGDGQFTAPLDLALAPDGTLWVTDDKRQNAQQFDLDGNVLSSFTLPDGSLFAWDHLIDAQGNHILTVANFDGHETTFGMIELDGAGALVRVFGGPSQESMVFTDELTEIATGPDGNLYVGSGIENGSSVKVFTPDGTLLGDIPTDAQVQGVAFDADGNLIVSAMGGGTLSSYQLTDIESTPVAETTPTVIWMSKGGADGFYKPGSITVAPDGNLWIADNGNSQFQILAPDGTFLERWGEQGKGAGQFELRTGPENDGFGNVVFAPDGSFFVLDGGNFRVQHFGADRSFIAAWGEFGTEPGTFQWPMDLAVDASGTVWVIDGVRHDVQQFDADGTLLGSFDVVDADENPRETAGLAIGPDGLIYVMTQNKRMADGDILVYDPDGTFVRAIGDDVFERQSVRIAFDANGRIYATEFDDLGPNGRLHIFEPNGSLIRSIDIGGYPYGIAVDADGSAIVSQYLGGTVCAYSIPVE